MSGIVLLAGLLAGVASVVCFRIGFLGGSIDGIDERINLISELIELNQEYQMSLKENIKHLQERENLLEMIESFRESGAISLLAHSRFLDFLGY